MASPPIGIPLRDLPADAQGRFAEVMEWFNTTVGRLEGATLELGAKCDRISLELEDKNRRLESALEENKRMQRQMQHTRTLAALGEMAATVAHEIRNPLGGIGGFAGLLLRDLEPGDRRRALADRIVHGVASLNKIVSNLLVYTRPLELQLRRVEIVAWLEDLLKIVEADASAAGALRVERRYGFKRLEVAVDPEKLQQALLNLLVNAVQASGEGGGAVAVETSVAGGALVLAVEDHGPGIPENVRERIFNPFFTTKQQGTGLGLAIVQRIVDLHGGRIGVESRPGGPTRFEIRLDLPDPHG